MVAMSDPKTWVPYWNTRDCSQGFCSLYCPQWCNYKITPPPPPSSPIHSHRPYFSPLIIAIAGILATGFLLISYYAVMSKYCRNRTGSTEPDPGSSDEDQPVGKNGLGEARIKSIAIFKYKMGDAAVDGSDCPVCLGEFQDDDRLRLLPTCRHAFHVACIDPWLKSNSNCPLCRASIVLSMDQERASDDDEAEIPIADNGQHSVIPIADNHGWENQEIIRRSLSMNYVFHQSGRLSVADILRMDDDDHFPDSRLRHTLSLSRAKFLFPMLNRGRLATIPF